MGHGNIKAYLHKYKIIDDPTCLCNKGHQTVQHIIFDCPLLEKERKKLKAVVKRTEKWPVSCNKLGVRYNKNFKEYINNINWNVEQNSNNP
jgi:CRISPR/Cas system-associated endoribonuclease Cas2